MSRSGGGNVAKVSPGVYKKVLRVREAYPFDIACLLMRFFGSMLNIGVVTMITLSGYSFLTAGLSSSLIALSIFVVTPRVSKRIDERGQSAVVPKAAAMSLLGLVVLIANVALHGPVWPLFVGALLVGFFPSPQAMARARWTYLIRSGRLGETAPDLRTMFSYESVLDDMAFIFSPSISIALAAAIAPVAGMVCGGVALCPSGSCFCARRRAPSRIPAGRRVRPRGAPPMSPALSMLPKPSATRRERARPLRRARSPRGRLPSLRRRPRREEPARHLLGGARAVRDLRLRRVVPRPVRHGHGVAFRGLEQPRFRRCGPYGLGGGVHDGGLSVRHGASAGASAQAARGGRLAPSACPSAPCSLSIRRPR